MGEGLGSNISMQVAFAVRELTLLPAIQAELGAIPSVVAMLLNPLKRASHSGTCSSSQLVRLPNTPVRWRRCSFPKELPDLGDAQILGARLPT